MPGSGGAQRGSGEPGSDGEDEATLFVEDGRAGRTRAVRMADIGDTGVSFENVAREWRCKYTAGASGGPGDSASLKACQALLDEYLPKIKALPKASVTRQVCGGCLDFKVSITQPLDEKVQ